MPNEENYFDKLLKKAKGLTESNVPEKLTKPQVLQKATELSTARRNARRMDIAVEKMEKAAKELNLLKREEQENKGKESLETTKARRQVMQRIVERSASLSDSLSESASVREKLAWKEKCEREGRYALSRDRIAGVDYPDPQWLVERKRKNREEYTE